MAKKKEQTSIEVTENIIEEVDVEVKEVKKIEKPKYFFVYGCGQGSLNLRVAPDFNANVLGYLREGEKVMEAKSSEPLTNDFKKIITKEGVTGYAHSTYLKE